MTLPHFRFSVIIISKTKTLYDARMYCKLVCGNDDDDQHKRNYLQPYKSFWKLRKFVFLNVVLYIYTRWYIESVKLCSAQRRPLVRIYSLCVRSFIWKFGEDKRAGFLPQYLRLFCYIFSIYIHIIRNDLPSHKNTHICWKCLFIIYTLYARASAANYCSWLKFLNNVILNEKTKKKTHVVTNKYSLRLYLCLSIERWRCRGGFV